MKVANQIAQLKPEGAYEVLSRSEELVKQGNDIIHLEIGQPDFPTPPHIVDAAVDALKSGKTKYTPPLGIMPLREAIALMITKTRNMPVFPTQIAVTPSGKNAIFTAMSLIIEPGSEVIYPNPSFPIYEVMTEYLGGIPKPIPLLEENSFSFDMRVFRKMFSKKTRLIILNSPSNPTGGVMPLKDLQEIADTIRGTDCWVITDEIYAQMVYGGKPYPSFYGLSGVQDQTILVDGLSKTYSMTGWRIGYLAAPEKFMKYIDYFLTHTVACTAMFTQIAAVAAYTGPQDACATMVQEFEARRNFIIPRLNSINGVICQKPEGAFYAFPNVKSFKKSSQWLSNYLLKHGIAVLDGTSFGEYGEGYLRISYSNSMKNLEEGMRRLEKALGEV